MDAVEQLGGSSEDAAAILPALQALGFRLEHEIPLVFVNFPLHLVRVSQDLQRLV